MNDIKQKRKWGNGSLRLSDPHPHPKVSQPGLESGKQGTGSEDKDLKIK